MKKETSVTEFWNSNFGNMTRDPRTVPIRFFAQTVKKLRAGGVKDVLDLGCGFGRWSIPLAREGFKVSAVDISERAIRILNDWAAQEKVAIETRVSPIQEIDIGNGRFDAVICPFVLDHLRPTDSGDALERIWTSLREGGLFYVSFDGKEEADAKNFVTLDDGTQKHVSGPQKGMIWRYLSNGEILDLLGRFRISEFLEKPNGSRVVWAEKRVVFPEEPKAGRGKAALVSHPMD